MSKEKDIEFLGKISTKTLGISMDNVRENVKKSPARLFQVYGEITNRETGQGDNGEWTKFKGAFEAINCLTGEISRSGALFLPNNITPMVDTYFSRMKNEDKTDVTKGLTVMLVAFEVGAKKSDVPIGYEYTVKSLLPTGETGTDPLAQLREKLSEKLMLPKTK